MNTTENHRIKLMHRFCRSQLQALAMAEIRQMSFPQSTLDDADRDCNGDRHRLHRLSQVGKSLVRQRRDVKGYATEHGTELVAVYGEGKRSSGFDTDRPEYTALREHVADGGVKPSSSRTSRASHATARNASGSCLTAMPLVSRSTRSSSGAVDLDDRALVHQSIRASTDDLKGRKEVALEARDTGAHRERLRSRPFAVRPDLRRGRPLLGPHPRHRRTPNGVACIRLREDGRSWRESERNYVSKGTARRIYTRRERYLPANSNECSPTPPPNHTAGSSSV